MFLCPYCSAAKYDSINSLRIHCSKLHKVSSEKMYLDVLCGGQRPLCKCGCGKETKYLDLSRGFSNFVPGHQSRVSNNFQTAKSKTNSLITRRKKYATNELVPWNKGLTKETHSSVALYGTKGSQTIRSNPEELNKRSERMKNNRRSGVIPTLTGEKHSQWKGGISSLNHVCRTNTKLYHEWKYPLLVEANFSCQNCGATSHETSLEVHHNKERHSSIVKLIAERFGWSTKITVENNPDDPTLFELKQKISDAVAEYHVTNKVSGLVLCIRCHEMVHENEKQST